jgi:transposase-like protein
MLKDLVGIGVIDVMRRVAKAGTFKVLRDLNTIHTKRNGVYVDECQIRKNQ